MTSNIYATAFKLHTLGYSVIPSGGGVKGKAPWVDWKDFQGTPPDDNQIEEWESTLHPALWGIVTNDRIAVIDADTPETRAELEAEIGEPHVTTPRGGAHWYVDTDGHPMKTAVGVVPGVDVRGSGGFVNIVGGDYHILRLPVPDALIPWGKLPKHILAALSFSKPVQKTKQGTPIQRTTRNATLASIAGAMRWRGADQNAIEAALLEMNARQCQPPLPEEEVRKIARSISKYPTSGEPNSVINNTSIICPSDDSVDSKRDKNVTDSVTTSLAFRIEDWAKESSGWFSYEDMDRDLNIRLPEQKDNRRQTIKRLKDAGKLEAHPQNNKLLRYINSTVRLIDFKSASKRTPLALKYPLGIEKYFNTYPGNIIVVAGSADAGKTGFLLNFIRNNQSHFSIYYQSSEMGREELAARLCLFDGISLEEWNFTAEEKSGNYADAIRPDCINIIDYMELSSDFFKVAEYLKQIRDKLGGGICIVALQKKRGAVLGRGGDFGLEKPRLYLSMDTGKLTIQKAKNWVDPTKNPNFLTTNFKLVSGCKFIVTEDWHKDE